MSTNVPKAAKAIESMLLELGINEYEPRVVNLLLDFSFKYVSDVLDDARIYSEYAKKQAIDGEDIKLAIRLRSQNSFALPPPAEVTAQLAAEKNSIPLPEIKPQHGISLPPDRYCLLQPNYKLKSTKQAVLVAPKLPAPMGYQGNAGASRPQYAVRPAGGVQQPSGISFHASSSQNMIQPPRPTSGGLFRIITEPVVEAKKRKIENLDEDYDEF